MPEEIRQQISPNWLAMVEQADSASPWVHGFAIKLRDSQRTVGECGFKGPPDESQAVEIAYAIEPDHQNNGYATESTQALVDFALTQDHVVQVLAHTLPENNPSTRVLAKCGFRFLGEITDPEDGIVWRWTRDAESCQANQANSE